MRNQDDLSDENLALIFKHIDKLFDEAQHTGVLNLSSKKLTNLPRSVTQFDLSDLHFADFSKNCLHHFPNFIFNFLSLEELDVHRNSLKFIPDSISQLKNLLVFNIASNQLTTFPTQACVLHNLQILNISSNKITSLPSDIHLLSSLMQLDASNNLLTELPESFHQLFSLQSLDLHRNHITSLPLNISDVPLIRMNVSVNLITHLPESLHLMKSLELLVLHDNPLVFPPPHIVLKGKEHMLAYMKRLRVEQNKKRLEVVIRNSSSEHQYLGSLSASRLAQRRLDSDTCLNTHLYTPLVHHRVNPLTSGKKTKGSSYATSTIDVAYHRRQKEKLADFDVSPQGKVRRKSDTQSDEDRKNVNTFRKLSVGSSGNVHTSNTDIILKRSQKTSILKVTQANLHHKKPPMHSTPSSYRKQVSLVDLSKRNQHRTFQHSNNKVSGDFRNDLESTSEEEEDSDESSSEESNRTLSAGSRNDRSVNGSLEKVKSDTRIFGNRGSTDEGKKEGGKSIEETIKRTLMNLTQPDPNLKFNLSDSYGEETTTFPATESNPSEKQEENDEEDDDEEDEDISDYGDGIDDEDEEEEEENKYDKKHQSNTFKRAPNNKQQRSAYQKVEEEFVAKASALKQQREREARKIKKTLYSPPAEPQTTNKGLSLKCQQMLEAMSSELNSQDPVLTIRRNLEHSAIEKQQAKKLKKTLEDVLHCRLHGDVGACLQDGVLLCKLVNKLFPGSVPKIHLPANRQEKLSDSKSRKNVENFLIASRKLGLTKEVPKTFENAIMALIVHLDKFINATNPPEHKLLNGHNGHITPPCSFIKHTNTPPTLRDKNIACFCIGFFVCTCLALFFYPLPTE